MTCRRVVFVKASYREADSLPASDSSVVAASLFSSLRFDLLCSRLITQLFILIGIAMHIFGPKHPLFVVSLVMISICCAYLVMLTTGTTLADAQAMGWFYSGKDLLTEVNSPGKVRLARLVGSLVCRMY